LESQKAHFAISHDKIHRRVVAEGLENEIASSCQIGEHQGFPDTAFSVHIHGERAAGLLQTVWGTVGFSHSPTSPWAAPFRGRGASNINVRASNAQPEGAFRLRRGLMTGRPVRPARARWRGL